MSKPEYYPIDRDAASIYGPIFTGEHWQDAPNLPMIAPAIDESMLSSIAVGLQYESGVKICKLAEIGREGAVLAEVQSVGALLKSTYEAIQIRRRKGKDFSTEAGEYSAAELPLGFSVRYNSPGYEATYVQRTVGHLVLKDRRGSNIFRRVLAKMDFMDGSLVDEEVLDTNPFESLRAMHYPATNMGPSRLSGWRLGVVYEAVSKTWFSVTEQKLRIARTEVFTPQRQGGIGRSKKVREVKKAELRLHT